MKRHLLFWATIISVFLACNNIKAPLQYGNAIQGLASPIRMQLDTTRVLLTDYFADPSKIEKIGWNKLTWEADTLGVLTLIGAAPTRLSNLEVTYEGLRYDIPVFATNKIRHTFSYKPSSTSVKEVLLAGSMNGWNAKATPLRNDGKQWSTDLVLTQGLYQYRIWEDGKEMMDASNPNTISNGMGGFNNTFQVGEATTSQPLMFTDRFENGIIRIKDSDLSQNVLVYYNNALIESSFSEGDIQIAIPQDAKQVQRSHIRVFADNGKQLYNDVIIPLENGQPVLTPEQLQRSDLHGNVMYFVMVDRFVNGDSLNDRPTPDPRINPKANNLGGDLQGITRKIQEGYFDSLGINTIWISPITKNAEGAWGLWNKGVESTFSAYHGYWPTALRQIDSRFGNDAAMRELLKTAHDHNMNVLLDYVAHHVHQEHPLYKQKPEWTTPLYLPDGTMNTEKWDEHRLTTWFDTFLPTWKFADHEVVEALTDTAMYWVTQYELDGFRHDATKHINEDFWRSLTRKVKNYQQSNTNRSIYQIGETYGSPELISSYISSGQLDAQFDFNLYDAAVDAFAKTESSFDNLERVLKESMSYYGSHHLMGNITGNQDRARFISYADGSIQFSEDAKLAGWTRDIQNNDTAGWNALENMIAFLMTTPGIPCIYYGDEIGMPGGNDPDNRRMMHFNDWNSNQKQLQSSVQQLVNLRRNNLAFVYGDLQVLYNNDGVLVLGRKYFQSTALIVLCKKAQQAPATISLPVYFHGTSRGAFSSNGIACDGQQITIPAGSTGYQIFTK